MVCIKHRSISTYKCVTLCEKIRFASCELTYFVFMTTDTSFYLTKSNVEMVLQSNLGQEDYKVLYRELYSIPPPTHGSHSMLGIKLWLLTSPMRSWMELAWGLYRSHLDNALKQARFQIIQDEGERSINSSYLSICTIKYYVTILPVY